MNGYLKRASVFILLVGISFFFLDCKNPFTQIGLGDKIDLDVPDLSVDSHDNGDFVKGSIDLGGRYADDIDIASVRVSVDGGVTFQNAVLDKPNKTWELSIDTTAYAPDGEKELVLIVEDTSGKEIEKRLFLFFDNQPPLVLVTVPYKYEYSPPTDTNTFNGVFNIKGEAADRFGIYRVTVEIFDLPMGPSPVATYTATGTSSWSASIDSTALTGGSDDFIVEVTAEDNAGNTNTYFYNYKDIYIANGGSITVEDLNAIDQGQDLGYTLGPVDLPTYRKYHDPLEPGKFELKIDQAQDLPYFTISNPDEGSPPDQNVLGSGAKATGIVQDDDGVETGSIEVIIDGGAPVTPDQIFGSGVFVQWQHDLPVLSEGVHDIQVHAQDIFGASNVSNVVGFTIDLGAPTVDVTSPAQGSYFSNNFLIEGEASDPQGVTSVKVSTDGGVTYNDATDTGGGFSTWEYTVSVPGDGTWDGSRTIKVQAVDGSLKTGTTNLQVVIDTEDPAVSFLTPGNSSTVNGVVLVKGTASDNNQVTKVELKIGKSDPWIEMTGTYNWEYTIDTISYANGTHSDETPPASDVWKLNIQARVTDSAGNIWAYSNYNLYIDNDMDKPSVNVITPSDGQNIGGSVLVSGTAFDDDAVQKVQMKLDLDNDGLFTNQYDLNGNSNTTDKFENETQWEDISGTTSWTQDLNTAGELYQTPGSNDGWITVRVRAVDINDVAGNYVEFTIHFDDTIPRFENLSHLSGDYVKGTFNLTTDVLDNVEVSDIYISYDGGVNYDNILNDPAYIGTFVQNAINDYDLDIPIDTSATSSGILYLRLKVVDNANFQKLEYMNLNVDNVYPTGAYTGNSMDIYGDQAFSRLQGTAEDTGSVSGIEEIHVYFVRGGDVYNPQTGAATAWAFNDFGDGAGNVPYTTDSNYKIIIDNRYELGNDGGAFGDVDGHDESLTVSGSTYNWWAEFDSAQIADGTIDIHYVVFDNAGNGHHYLEPGFIKNNKPVIPVNGVTVGSDVDMSNVVEGDEQFIYTGAFTARNRLYIGINATDDDPPGLIYEVFHDPSGFNTKELAAASGQFSITASPEYDDGATATEFLCRVTDSDGIVVERTINVIIDNDDDEAPMITINNLTQSNVVAGHLEQDGDSLHDGTDPDVSGTITLTGTSSDDQRIQSITVKIDEFNAGSGTGFEHTVAFWDVDSLEPELGSNFMIDSQTLDEAGGHVISWTYTWNTADITGAARDNLNIQFKVFDFNPNSVTDTTIVDVVPYISGIERTLTTHRSKYGKFQVQKGESNLTINGYNLDDSGTHWIRVYNTASDDYDDVTVPATVSPFTSMTVNLTGVTHSGWLRLMVNGVEAINNTNDNTLLTNREDDGNGLGSTLWTDDRYLRVWAVGGAFQQSSGAQYPSMSIMADGTLYGAWINYATSLLTYGTTSTAPVTQWGIYDPPEYTDMNVDATEATLKYAIAFAANHYGGSGWGNVPLDVGTAGFVGVRTPNSRRVDAGYGNAIAYPIESLNLNQQLWQFSRPKVVRSNGGASDAQDRLHVAYYDSKTRAAKYSYMLDDGQATARGWLVLDGGTDAEDVRYVTGVGTRPNWTTVTDAALAGNSMIANGQTIMLMDTNGNSSWTTIQSGAGTGTLTLANTANTARTHYTIVTGTSNLVPQGTGVAQSTNAGEYVAIDVDEDGMPVVIYYNTSAQTLRLARANKVNPTAPADWTRQNVFAGGDPNAQFSGQHVAMKFDASGGLHVVCYRSSAGDLLYLYAPDADGTDYVFQNSVVVDSEGAVGTSPDITLNGTTPYISYLNNSMIGTFEGLKMAYYDGSLGDWEYEIVPVITGVSDNRTNLEYQKGTVNWLIAIGYASSNFDIVYLEPEE